MILIRSALFNGVFYALTFIVTVLAAVSRLVAPSYMLVFIRLWARLLVRAAHLICGIRLQVSGLENIPSGAALIASGHQSAFDTFVWFTLVPDCCYVVKQELTKIPLFGSLLEATDQIAVDRSSGASAIRTLVRQGSKALRDGRQVVIFPEGTRTDPGTVGALQPGVAALSARTGQPVIPVATDSGRCWSRGAFVKRPGVITIAIGTPIPAGLPREVLLNSLRERFATLNQAETVRVADAVQGQESGGEYPCG